MEVGGRRALAMTMVGCCCGLLGTRVVVSSNHQPSRPTSAVSQLCAALENSITATSSVEVLVGRQSCRRLITRSQLV